MNNIDEFDLKLLIEVYETKKKELEEVGLSQTEIKKQLEKEFSKEELKAIEDYKKRLLKIHPILDFKNNIVYLTIWFPIEEEGELKEKPFIITSKREKFSIEQLPKNIKLQFYPHLVRSIEDRWSLESVNEFLTTNTQIDIKLVFEKVKNLIKKHIELPEEGFYDFIALWIIGTYFYPLFEAYPYLFINAQKRSGKTKLLTLISLLASNGVLTGSITEASTFRPTERYRNTLCIDEIEQISSREYANLRDLLKFGYKKGLVIRRQGEKRKDITFEYDVYCPKALANIQGFEEILEDRGFVIIMERSTNSKIINTIVSREDPEIKETRNMLYNLLMSDIVYRMSSVTSVTSVTNSDSSDSSDSDTDIIEGRWKELSLPILTLAKVTDNQLFTSMIGFISQQLKRKEIIDLVESRDMIFLTSLITFITHRKEEEFYPISEIRNHLIKIEGEEKWITNEWIGRALRRLNLRIEQRRTAKAREVKLNFKNIEEKATKYGLNIEKIHSEYEESEREEEAKKEDYQKTFIEY